MPRPQSVRTKITGTFCVHPDTHDAYDNIALEPWRVLKLLHHVKVAILQICTLFFFFKYIFINQCFVFVQSQKINTENSSHTLKNPLQLRTANYLICMDKWKPTHEKHVSSFSKGQFRNFNVSTGTILFFPVVNQGTQRKNLHNKHAQLLIWRVTYVYSMSSSSSFWDLSIHLMLAATFILVCILVLFKTTVSPLEKRKWSCPSSEIFWLLAFLSAFIAL